MSFISHVFSEPIIYALGWTLFHALWQGLLLAVLLAIAMQFIPKRNASMRYAGYGLAFVALFVASVTTFISLYWTSSNMTYSVTYEADVQIIFTPTSTNVASFSLLSQIQQVFSYFNDHINIITSLWLCGVVVFLGHLLNSFFHAQQLRHKHNWQLSEPWENRMNKIAHQLGVRRAVTLLASNITEVPLVIGYLKPMILLPVGAVNNLSVEEVEAILAHELAHIARNDYFFNILQAFLDVLFFYHPIAWWISTNIRIERENCCDDLAMTVCNNNLTYAKALANLSTSSATSSSLALGMLGVKNQLLNRIKRILNQPYNRSTNMEKFVVTCVLLMVLCFLSIQQNKAADAVVENTTWMPADTIPNLAPGKMKIKVNKNGQRIESELENGVIQSLTIDGKAISKEKFESYEPMLEKIIAEAPPVPPVPPVPPTAETPPAPPAPDSPTVKKKVKIRTDKKADGSTFLYIEGDETITIELDETNENIIVDGKTLKIGEDFVVETEEEDIDVQLDALDSLERTLLDIERLTLKIEKARLDSTLQALKKMQGFDQNPYLEFQKQNEALMKQQKALMEQLEKEQKELHSSLFKDNNEMFEAIKRGNELHRAFAKQLMEELKKDGLVSEKKANCEIEIFNDKMTINKKKQLDAVHQKYLEFYKTYFKKELKESYYLKFHNSELQ